MKYVDLDYKPKKTDIICEFKIESKLPMEKAAKEVAAESSVGTWTKLTTMNKEIEAICARAFYIKGKTVKIAYPIELFEMGSVPQLLSSVAGNIFGIRQIDNLRLEDIELPEVYVKSFNGPAHGLDGVRKTLDIKDRPLCGTIIKPKLGLRTDLHAKVAYEAWAGGIDIVKDDENLTNQNFNPFKERIVKTLDMRDRAEAETGETKVYMPNVTANCEEMIRRAEYVEECEGKYVMVDVLTVGFSALDQLLKKTNLIVHAHRAMHAAITRNDKHGISMLVLAKLLRMVGVDQLHTGTVVGKMQLEHTPEINNFLRSKWYHIKPTFPVASGGLYPNLVPELIRILGKDIIIQAGGGVHGHPDGTKKGAMAMRQAIDAAMNNISLKEYAKDHKELSVALKTWDSRTKTPEKKK
jgi:ribulose-bisphosphate carboxylase large chain